MLQAMVLERQIRRGIRKGMPEDALLVRCSKERGVAAGRYGVRPQPGPALHRAVARNLKMAGAGCLVPDGHAGRARS